MKLKKFLLGGLLSFVGFASVFAIIQPNIIGWTTTTSIDPTLYYMIVQSGTTQRKILASDFANSISGSLGLSGYIPMSVTGSWNTAANRVYTYSGNALYFYNNSGDYYTTGDIDDKLLALIGGMHYMGDRDMSSGDYPATMATGDFYIISTHGTGDGIYYAIGDMMVANKSESGGTEGSDWGKIQNVNPEIDPAFTAWLASIDYTGRNNTTIWVNTYSGQALYRWNNSGSIVTTSMTGNWNLAYSIIQSQSGIWSRAYNNSGDFLPWTGVITYPGTDNYVPTTKAVADYIEAMALNLGDVITTGGFYISGASTARRTIETGSRYRIEYATGLLGPWKTAGMLDNGGTYNTTFGVGAGRDITAGIFNTFIGHEAGRFNTDGNRNTAVGGYAMYSLTNGTDNTCIGIYCMQKLKTGKYNVGIGDESLWSNQTGDNNVAIGMGAGEYAEGSNNVFIGRFADITGNTYLNNSIALGERALVWTSSMMQIGNTGLNFISTRAKLGIGVQFPTNALSVSGSIDIPATEWMYFGTGRRIGTSGSNLSIQAYTGGNRVEKSVFIP